LERHPGYAATLVTDGFKHLARFPVALAAAAIESILASTAVFACCSAGGTPGWFIGKTLLSEKFLFSRSKFKFTFTVPAN
jgi:hypothetical protein